MSGKLFAVAAIAALVCGPAFAADASVAQLDAVKGSVMVSQNGKMVAASTASLKAGDRVVAPANGSASVKFADGCVVAVKPASMITIAAKSPCASGAGLTVVDANVQQMSEATAGWVAAGAFVVVGGALVAAGDDNNSNSP
jgi:hypothetical protein